MPEKSAPVYTYCETATAGPTTPNHIRELSEQGMKTGGGADTKALCGREVAWDLREADLLNLEAESDDVGYTFICPSCRDAAEKIVTALPEHI
ncbi:hypothetical protein ACFVAJ_19325 [Agromyces sp. NPDC057679]|uniref:hypothetical protein n=1 Tax=Agromyces sp. NPDC057679 TaxID=3346207 RepID=UPI00366F46C7